jgi:hypothetical protein
MIASMILLFALPAHIDSSLSDVPAPPNEDEVSIYRFPWATQKYCSRKAVLTEETTGLIKGVSTEIREYDARDRLSDKKTHNSDGSTTETTYTYEDPSTVREDRMENGKKGEVIFYHLDRAGRIASLRHEGYPNGTTTVDYTLKVRRDAHGHLDSYTDGKVTAKCQLGHDGGGRLVSRNCRSGLDTAPLTNNMTFAYNNRGLLIGYSVDAVVREHCAVVRREDGRVIAVICRAENGDVAHFRTMAYDQVGNLIEELDEGFSMFGGLVTTNSYGYNCWPATAPVPNSVDLTH